MVVFAEESFTNVQTEIAELIHDHWLEVRDSDKVPLDVDWDKFRTLEQLEILKTLTARENGELVGYILHILCPLLHYKSVLASHDDAFYLKRTHRKGMTGAKMFRAAEEMLKRYGVNRVYYHEKLKAPMGKVFEYLKYRTFESIWSKELN